MKPKKQSKPKPSPGKARKAAQEDFKDKKKDRRLRPIGAD